MSESLRTAFQEAAKSTPALGDPVAARQAASRRRRSRWAGGTVAIAAVTGLVWIGGAQISHRSDEQPTDPATPPVTAPSTPPSPESSKSAKASSETSSVGPALPLLYRSCNQTCRVGISDHGVDTGLRPGLAHRLAESGLDDVSLSPDGLLVAIPHDGALTVTHVFSQPAISITVPSGAAGSVWRPYFWSRGDQALVIAQWAGDKVRALGAIHVGYNSPPGTEEVRRVTGDPVVPTDPHGVVDNLIPVMRPNTQPAAYQSRGIVVGPSIYRGHAGSFSHSWTQCLRSGESLLGKQGARTSFIVAGDTSPDQRDATVIYRSTAPTPVAVANGICGSPKFARYDLPVSSGDTTWRLLGPLNHRSSLMTRDNPDGSLDVVAVSANRQRVVDTLPAGAEVVATGTTGGFFE
jgi:hypothetical protein